MTTNPYRTLTDAARELGLGRSTIYRLRKVGRLKEYLLDGRKYVRLDELLALITPAPHESSEEETKS